MTLSIDGNITQVNHKQAYLYGYFSNAPIQLEYFLYQPYPLKNIPQAIRSQNNPQEIFKQGLEITAHELNDDDFLTYWQARLQYPVVEANEVFKHLYEYRTIKGILYDYHKNSYAYQLYLKANNNQKIILRIPKNVSNNFNFRGLKNKLNQEVYAVSLIQEWGEGLMVMIIHHPNQLITFKDGQPQKLLAKKED